MDTIKLMGVNAERTTLPYSSREVHFYRCANKATLGDCHVMDDKCLEPTLLHWATDVARDLNPNL